MENTGATKRTLDEGVEVNTKRFKIDDLQFLPSTGTIRSVRDPRKWSQLPSIVYELLTLFKKSEKFEEVEEDEKLVCVTSHVKRFRIIVWVKYSWGGPVSEPPSMLIPIVSVVAVTKKCLICLRIVHIIFP